MKRDDYWELFWLSGLPEAWMMSIRSRGDLNAADRTAKTLPHGETGLPREAEELCQKKEEQGATEVPGPSLTGE